MCDMESIMPISLIHINLLYSPCLKIAPCCFKQLNLVTVIRSKTVYKIQFLGKEYGLIYRYTANSIQQSKVMYWIIYCRDTLPRVV